MRSFYPLRFTQLTLALSLPALYANGQFLDRSQEPEKVGEDQIEEIVSLYSSLYGEELSKKELLTLYSRIEDVVVDDSIPDSIKCELEALLNHAAAIEGDSHLNPSEWARVEEELIEKYPKEDSPYIGLLGAAEYLDSDENQLILLEKLRTTLLTPDWVRDRAESAVQRFNLIGLSLESLVQGLIRTPDEWKKQDGALIYSFSSSMPENSPALREVLEAYKDVYPNAFVLQIPVCGETGEESDLGFSELPSLPNAGTSIALLSSRLYASKALFVYCFDDYGILREIQSVH